MKKRNCFYRHVCVLLIFIPLFIGLAGCTSSSLPDYRVTPFNAEIRYELHGTVITAELSVRNALTNVTEKRDLELRFTSPPEISGLCVHRKDGVTSISRGDTVIKTESDAAAAGFLRAAELMIYGGELHELEKSEENGLFLHHAKIVGASGEVELWCDDTGVPKRITDGSLLVTVIRFEAA